MEVPYWLQACFVAKILGTTQYEKDNFGWVRSDSTHVKWLWATSVIIHSLIFRFLQSKQKLQVWK